MTTLRRSVPAALVFAGLAAPAPAFADFGPGRTVTPAGSDPREGAVAVADAGRTVIAWRDLRRRTTSEVRVRRANADGLGRVQTLGRGAYGIRTAIGPDGTAVVAWADKVERGRRVRAAVAAPGRRFGPARTLHAGGGAGVYVIGVTVDPGGRALVVYNRDVAGRFALEYAVRPRGEGFERPESLGRAGYFGGSVALAGDGTVVAAWAGPTDEVNSAALIATLAPRATRFTTATPLPGTATGFPRVVTGPGGTGVALQQDSARGAFVPRATDGIFAAPLPIFDFGIPGEGFVFGFEGPAVALPAGGAAVAATSYTVSENPEDPRPVSGRLDVATREPGGAFGSPRTLSRGDRIASGPAAAATGDASVVTWLEQPVANRADRVLRYAETSSGTALGGRRTLAAEGAVEPASLAAAGDRLVALWRAHPRRLRLAEWRAPRR